jgi:hypothetical protein
MKGLLIFVAMILSTLIVCFSLYSIRVILEDNRNVPKSPASPPSSGSREPEIKGEELRAV